MPGGGVCAPVTGTPEGIAEQPPVEGCENIIAQVGAALRLRPNLIVQAATMFETSAVKNGSVSALAIDYYKSLA